METRQKRKQANKHVNKAVCKTERKTTKVNKLENDSSFEATQKKSETCNKRRKKNQGGYTSTSAESEDSNKHVIKSKLTKADSPHTSSNVGYKSSAHINTCEENCRQQFVDEQNTEKDMEISQIPDFAASNTNIQSGKPYQEGVVLNTLSSPYDNLTATLSGEINVKLPDEKQSYLSYITGMETVGTNKLAVANRDIMTIKIVDTKEHLVLSKKILPHKPQDITLLPANQLAVTLPSEGKILVLSLADEDELMEVRQINTETNCRGIAYINEKLVITFQLPGKVHIITMEGEVLNIIQHDFRGREYFLYPFYVKTDEKSGKIYVTDTHFGGTNITTMNSEGTVTHMFNDSRLDNTFGLVVLDDSSILVCSRNSSVIRLVSPDFQKTRFIMCKKDQFKQPQSMAFDRDHNKLFVSSWDSTSLYVYDLKTN